MNLSSWKNWPENGIDLFCPRNMHTLVTPDGLNVTKPFTQKDKSGPVATRAGFTFPVPPDRQGPGLPSSPGSWQNKSVASLSFPGRPPFQSRPHSSHLPGRYLSWRMSHDVWEACSMSALTVRWCCSQRPAVGLLLPAALGGRIQNCCPVWSVCRAQGSRPVQTCSAGP